MEKITIIFGTVMGSAEGCALKISELLTTCNLENEVIDMEEYVEDADRKKGEIGQKSAVFMILRRFATGKS